jgi:magnesium-transporting ATPase (P-type)
MENSRVFKQKKNSGSAWHNNSPQEVLVAFKSDCSGLSQAEAERRLELHGPNRLEPPKQQGPFIRFLMQFHNVLIYVLLAAAMMTIFLGHWIDTGVILGVVVINAVIGFVQEGEAKKALDAIRQMLSLQATVLREKTRSLIPAEEVVPGDIVFLQPGDKVPADLRLLEVKNLRIEEASLTGESEPVEKFLATVEDQAAIGDRFCMAYSSTLVVYGQGIGVVVATGTNTEIGQISSLLEQIQELTTPLLEQITKLGRWLSVAILGLAASTFLYGFLFRNYAVDEMFLAAVSLAVAAIPEGLPAIMTITLALGVRKMAQCNAIIRHLPSVETLGAVTVICTDKTGTLTRNEMTVQRLITADEVFEVSGVGYEPHGGFSRNGQEVSVANNLLILDMLRAGLLCNNALLKKVDGIWKIEGAPTEGALIPLAIKAGFDPGYERESLPRTDVIPFESEHRFMATLHHDHAGNGFIYVNGAPEQVLEMCANQHNLREDLPLDIAYWSSKMEEIASRGQRLLAVAVKSVETAHRELIFSDMEQGFTLLGMFGIIDPPRDEAITAVRKCQSAGIRVKMITGDHVVTARAIGTQLGIGNGQAALTGSDLEKMDDAQLQKMVVNVDIFARASPKHKLRLVKALQANGEIVAMTGDGVNDTPALKRADVSVSMGMKGTEAAKEASKIVLADDNFASIAHAVEVGRTIYDNIRKAIIYVIPTNGGEAGLIVIAILLGVTLPISPVQILWINMVTSVTLALALAFELPEAGIMQRHPRKPHKSIFSGFILWRITLVSVLLMCGSFGLFLWEQGLGSTIETSRTVAVNALVIGETFYLFNCRYLLASAISWKGFLDNRHILIAIMILAVIQLLFTYMPVMQNLFGTTAIDISAWARIVAFGILLFIAVEIEKYLIRKKN